MQVRHNILVPMLALFTQAVVLGEDLRPDFGVSATFSIVAVDPETGECGAAVASKYPNVGKVVPYVRSGVGAFCTQHWHNPAWGTKALDLLEAGRSSEEVLGMLLKDDATSDNWRLLTCEAEQRIATLPTPTRPACTGVR